MAKFNQAAPAFVARDFAGLAAFYCEVLEFEVAYRSDVYVVLRRDDVMLHVCPERDGKVAGHNSAYFFVDGVDRVYEQVRERATIVHPIRNQAYGLRDFLMQDPEGNNIGIAERLPDA